MHRHTETGGRARTEAATDDSRELFVTTDLRSIPASESRPLCGGLGAWLSALLTHKLLRTKSPPTYAIELRRWLKTRHVPKRMEKPFQELARRLESLGLTHHFDVTIPSIGPYSTASMVLSREDGELHAVASREVTLSAGQIRDQGYFCFLTWLADGSLLETCSTARLPRARAGVERRIVLAEDPPAVLQQHRERLRGKLVRAVPPEGLFERLEAEHQRRTEDLLRRGVIRPATAAEVTRIRSETRV
jgi:hypothetical protein